MTWVTYMNTIKTAPPFSSWSRWFKGRKSHPVGSDWREKRVTVRTLTHSMWLISHEWVSMGGGSIHMTWVTYIYMDTTKSAPPFSSRSRWFTGLLALRAYDFFQFATSRSKTFCKCIFTVSFFDTTSFSLQRNQHIIELFRKLFRK